MTAVRTVCGGRVPIVAEFTLTVSCHFMAHLSITEGVPGDERPETDWGEHVTDEDYRRHR